MGDSGATHDAAALCACCPLLAASAIHGMCKALLNQGGWEDWWLTDLQPLASALCGVPSVRGDGDMAALSDYEAVLAQFEELGKVHPNQEDFWDPVYVILHLPAVPPPPPIAAAIQAWPPAPAVAGGAAVYNGYQPVDGSPCLFHFPGAPATAKEEAAAFIGYMLHAGASHAHMIMSTGPLARRP